MLLCERQIFVFCTGSNPRGHKISSTLVFDTYYQYFFGYLYLLPILWNFRSVSKVSNSIEYLNTIFHFYGVFLLRLSKLNGLKHFCGLTKDIGQPKKITCYCVKDRSLYLARAVTLRVVKYRILKYSILIPDTFLIFVITPATFEFLVILFYSRSIEYF